MDALFVFVLYYCFPFLALAGIFFARHHKLPLIILIALFILWIYFCGTELWQENKARFFGEKLVLIVPQNYEGNIIIFSESDGGEVVQKLKDTYTLTISNSGIAKVQSFSFSGDLSHNVSIKDPSGAAAVFSYSGASLFGSSVKYIYFKVGSKIIEPLPIECEPDELARLALKKGISLNEAIKNGLCTKK